MALYKSVDAAVSSQNKDVLVELIGTYLQRLTEVSAHRVALRNPAYTTLVHPCTAPTAGYKLKLIYDYWQTNPIPNQPNEPSAKRYFKLVIRQGNQFLSKNMLRSARPLAVIK